MVKQKRRFIPRFMYIVIEAYAIISAFTLAPKGSIQIITTEIASHIDTWGVLGLVYLMFRIARHIAIRKHKYLAIKRWLDIHTFLDIFVVMAVVALAVVIASLLMIGMAKVLEIILMK